MAMMYLAALGVLVAVVCSQTTGALGDYLRVALVLTTLAAIVAICMFVYFAPLVVCAKRGVVPEKAKWIVLVNAGLGWTGIGWIAAMASAMAAPTTADLPLTINRR